MVPRAPNDTPARSARIARQTGQGKSEAVTVPIIAELVRFNSSRLPAGWSDQWHLHPFHQVDAYLEGRGVHELHGGLAIPSRAGQGVIIPPLTWHRTTSRRGCWDVALKAYLSPHAAAAVGPKAMGFGLSGATQAMITHAVEMLAAGQRFCLDWAAASATAAVLDAIGAVPPAQVQPGGDDDQFRQKLLRILSETSTMAQASWSVRALAAQCSMSADHFTRLFERELGLTPREFLLENRMRLAATLLTGQPPRTVKQVAQMTGYTTVQAFGRAFRDAFDVSPAQFRRSPQDMHGPSRNRRKAGLRPAT